MLQAGAPLAGQTCRDHRYIVLPERISPHGVQASMCAATGSLVIRAAIASS